MKFTFVDDADGFAFAYGQGTEGNELHYGGEQDFVLQATADFLLQCLQFGVVVGGLCELDFYRHLV